LTGMVDSLMKILLHLVERPRIDSRFIGHNHFDVAADVGIDNLAHSLGLGILGSNEPQIAVALPDADDHGLVRFWTPSPRFAANIGFINLDSATEFFRRYFKHGSPDAMAEVPCRLIAHADCALNLTGGHSLFRFTKQRRCDKPFPQRQMGIVEDGSSGHAKLVMA